MLYQYLPVLIDLVADAIAAIVGIADIASR